MSNIAVQRTFLGIGIAIAATGGILAFAFMKFPENAVVIFLAVALAVGLTFYSKHKEKSARFNIFYSTIQDLGTPISFGNTAAAFERNGTRFDTDFPKGEHDNFFKVRFYLPNVREKFSIQNKSLLTEFHDDCQVIEHSALPQEYRLQSRNPEFLLNFLNQRQICNEVQNYPAGFFGRILISFDYGEFEMIWTPPLSEQIEGFYQVCHSAVVFHDELKKFQKN